MNDKPPSHHLIYKIWMFVELAEKRLGRCRHDRVLLNACVEARAIHARGLLDFLYKKNPRQDDYVAERAFPEQGRWGQIVGQSPGDLSEHMERINKNIPHLTYKQLTREEGRQPPDWPRIEAIISSGLSKFFDEFPKSEVCSCDSCKRILSLESVRALIGKH
ncbi:hypothetical protein [Marinicauda salina]|uniref:hypothetical protein n=1 Tax=Marinicauda salina TaxID=2135793 RepID=UPI0011B20D4D|nr:hypothetical protein [Marinicauda salina]